jgi:hypothetical protein
MRIRDLVNPGSGMKKPDSGSGISSRIRNTGEGEEVAV